MLNKQQANMAAEKIIENARSFSIEKSILRKKRLVRPFDVQGLNEFGLDEQIELIQRAEKMVIKEVYLWVLFVSYWFALVTAFYFFLFPKYTYLSGVGVVLAILGWKAIQRRLVRVFLPKLIKEKRESANIF